MTVTIVTYKNDVFDVQVNLSSKKEMEVTSLVASKGNDWTCETYTIDTFDNFIANIKRGFVVESGMTEAETLAEMSPKDRLQLSSK